MIAPVTKSAAVGEVGAGPLPFRHPRPTLGVPAALPRADRPPAERRDDYDPANRNQQARHREAHRNRHGARTWRRARKGAVVRTTCPGHRLSATLSPV